MISAWGAFLLLLHSQAKCFPQGTWEFKEEACNPQEDRNKSRARKETSLHVPVTKGTFLLGSKVLWKWGFLGS